MNRILSAAAVALSLSAATVQAQTAAPDAGLVDASVLGEIKAWAHHPVTLISVNAQNLRHADLSEDRIRALDKEWVEQRKSSDQPLIAQLFGSPLSTYLTRIKANSNGLITEVFVMDNKGLNVGQSSVTSDYWQGDEAKWQKTFLKGTDATFVDEPEFDEASGTHRVQVNMTVTDPQHNVAVGAITVEICLEELARQQSAHR